jgi:hypothetical protein
MDPVPLIHVTPPDGGGSWCGATDGTLTTWALVIAAGADDFFTCGGCLATAQGTDLPIAEQVST